MSATQYASLVLRTPTPRKRVLPSRSFPAGRLETLVLAAGICLPVPLLAATGLSVPLPNVVERIAAALVPWAAPVAPDAATPAWKGTSVRSHSDLAAVAPTAPAARSAGSVAPQQATREPSLLPLAPGAGAASTPTRGPIRTGSTPAATPSPTGAAEPEQTAEAPTSAPTPAEPAPSTPAQAPAPRATSEPAPAPAALAPAPTTPPTTTTAPLQETVDTVTAVVADPVGTVEETIADPIGTVEQSLPVLTPVTTPLKPLLPKLGGK
jgi:hypothetical protein